MLKSPHVHTPRSSSRGAAHIFETNELLMLRSRLRKLLILLMVIILIDFKTTMISMS